MDYVRCELGEGVLLPLIKLYATHILIKNTFVDPGHFPKKEEKGDANDLVILPGGRTGNKHSGRGSRKLCFSLGEHIRTSLTD